MKLKIFLSLTSLAISVSSYAQAFNKEKLDQYFHQLETNNKFMGSLAVSQNGKVIYVKSLGYADVATQQKANENTKYRIGSISKTFTAVLVLKAVEANKLKLSQTIDKYFPTIINADKITVQNLLNHRSGIHNFTDDKDYLSWNTQAKSEKEMIAIITKAGSDFAPDTKSSYSNSNYVLLTYILEKTFGKTYAELLKQHITIPLNLKNTNLGGKINPKNNEALSYDFDNQWVLEPETDISVPLGAGGIVSTPSDLITFGNGLFGGKLVSKDHLELMKTIKDGYGSGLFKFPFHENSGYGHTGGIDGFTSSFSHFDNQDVTFALTSNASNYNNNNIAIAVLSAVYGKEYEIPSFKNYTPKPEEIANYLGSYSSKDLPIKIDITNNKGVLTAQATGQGAFPLEAREQNIFAFEQAGVILEFNPKEKQMTLKQGGGTFAFTKD